MPSEERLVETKRQIRERLKTVCGHLSDDDFEQLVSKVAANELRSPHPLSPHPLSRDRTALGKVRPKTVTAPGMSG